MKINDIVYYVVNDFDGHGCFKCKVKDVCADHIIIVNEDGIEFYIDNEDIGQYTRPYPVSFKKKTTLVPVNQYYEVRKWE